ncbi:SDR family oxidoreductase [Undibacter mobilis]|uniref:SDR family NAD(P)-dependent oxidoreductase n=1 Tax=Undibacter mobilis TaxID=2292256 RepID=A0A371BDQ2_9BRAD|nr:SDR family oxidoreductase [Undibacter mobilis]RDV05647.1 SDR family NAD(P)-dependent oxidoreductase [Undibacter mobilis]
MTTLNGKKIVLLGGTSGIGLATAQAAAAEGAEIVVVSSRKESVDRALKALPAGARGHTADLTNEAELKALFERIGDFDHLVFTAGENLALADLDKTAVAEAQGFFKLRFWGAFTAAKYGHAHIRKGGSIMLTTGVAGARPQKGWSIAASLCTAMEGLTRALAVELAPIRVNAVSPGVVRTPLWAGMSEEDREALYRNVGAALPVGRVGEAEDVAQTYLYLMRNGFVSGQISIVDGGTVLV